MAQNNILCERARQLSILTQLLHIAQRRCTASHARMFGSCYTLYIPGQTVETLLIIEHVALANCSLKIRLRACCKSTAGLAGSCFLAPFWIFRAQLANRTWSRLADPGEPLLFQFCLRIDHPLQ